MRTWMTISVLVTLAAPAQASEHSLWWRAKAQAACLSDVIRLCQSAMPDEEKVTACMEGKKAKVNTNCASYYPGGENAD